METKVLRGKPLKIYKNNQSKYVIIEFNMYWQLVPRRMVKIDDHFKVFLSTIHSHKFYLPVSFFLVANHT